MKPFVLTPRAEQDVSDICNYIADDSIEAADRVLDALETTRSTMAAGLFAVLSRHFTSGSVNAARFLYLAGVAMLVSERGDFHSVDRRSRVNGAARNLGQDHGAELQGACAPVAHQNSCSLAGLSRSTLGGRHGTPCEPCEGDCHPPADRLAQAVISSTAPCGSAKFSTLVCVHQKGRESLTSASADTAQCRPALKSRSIHPRFGRVAEFDLAIPLIVVPPLT